MRRLLLLAPLLTAGCIDYWFWGKDPDANEGGRRPDRVPDDGHATGQDDTADTGEAHDSGWLVDDTGGDSGTVDPATCEGWAPPGAYTVSSLATCRNATPTIGIAPVLEWSWTANATNPGWDNIETTPLVAHLDDDDGDGLAGPGDVPDVVFTNQRGDDYWSGNNALTALDGVTGAEKWSIRSAGGYHFNSATYPAIGDLDADGTPEVCVSGYEVAVICVDGATGSFEWAAGSEISLFGSVAMGDMDGDGLGEVVYGRQIFDHQGNTLAAGTSGWGGITWYGFPSWGSVIADWDGDGVQELVAGNTVYEIDGTVAWSDGRNDGFPAIADLDGDGLPDMARSGDSSVRLVLNDGTQLWETATPGGGPGGPPSIADLDGDGTPEILVSDFSKLTAFTVAGGVLWQVGISDTSSGALSPSLFDFDQDGIPEVVYLDETAFRIYDGATGAVVFEDTGHASSSAAEYPVIADVDADGEAEILLPSNNGNFSGWNGLRVYGSGGAGWPPAREIWNQHAYTVTNVDDDGGLPAAPVNSWDLWNEFRAAGQTSTRSSWRADLQPGEVAVCLDDCDHELVHLSASLENEGLIATPAFTVHVLDGAGTELGAATTPAVGPGEGLYLEALAIDKETWGTGSLRLEVDVDGEVDECDETDNVLDLGPWPCE